mmetsp:Transcript_6971/g.22625  ORF Transcript_6971/g.22625 Transcript_6971/m.22625 type:complete len:216 (+) Transcript_6971:372-1019(+)
MQATPAAWAVCSTGATVAASACSMATSPAMPPYAARARSARLMVDVGGARASAFAARRRDGAGHFARASTQPRIKATSASRSAYGAAPPLPSVVASMSQMSDGTTRDLKGQSPTSSTAMIGSRRSSISTPTNFSGPNEMLASSRALRTARSLRPRRTHFCMWLWSMERPPAFAAPSYAAAQGAQRASLPSDASSSESETWHSNDVPTLRRRVGAE